METELIGMAANLGGVALFGVVVFIKLRDIAGELRKLSDAIIKMEERGIRLQKPTQHPPYYQPTPPYGTPIVRVPTEDGIG